MSSVDLKDLHHFKTRSVGQLRRGPIQLKGYVNNTKDILLNENKFNNSIEAEERHVRPLQRQYANMEQLISGNNLRFASRNDEF